jgi:HAD superfamily hydrolase (TIGR01484 family)
VNAFTAAHESGIEIFFVTGRPPRWMREIKDAFGFGNAICANGAMHYDLLNEKVIEEWLIPLDLQFEFVKRMRNAVPPISFATEYGDEFHHEIAYIPRWDVGVDNAPVVRIEEKLLKPAFKMLARCSDYEFTSDQLLAIAQREAGDLVTITHSNAGDSLLEISALGVSKGETLAKLTARMGFTSADVVTFGDNPNDFSMLSWADRSWAMADGHADASKYSKFVADPHHLDGVAIVIEELLTLPA